MDKINNFRQIIAWQKAHEMTLAIYKITSNYPRHEFFSLVSQIRRASVSVAANIVEGFRRPTIKDAIRFYCISDASLEEVKYHLLLSRDLSYISEEQYRNVMTVCEETGRYLTKWIQSQKKIIGV